MMNLEEQLRTCFLISSKCGSGFCPTVDFDMNDAKLSGVIRVI
jgi:hypothetical protein